MSRAAAPKGTGGDEALGIGWGEDEQMDGRTDSPCVLQDFVTFGAAALLSLNLNHTLLKQGTGTADHLAPLGSYSLYSSLFARSRRYVDE